MALESLGVPVAPLLTTLGIGSLAVALALQDTLANFFAGLHLLADRPVRPGDYIKLHEGEEGFVETIGWRSSRLRTTKNNIVVVPNQKLSQAILTNFHLPISNVHDDRHADGGRRRGRGRRRPRLNEELARAVAEIAELQRRQARRPAHRHQRRRPGLELRRRRQGRGGAGAGRPRGPQAPARPPATRGDRAGGDGKGLPAARKEPAQRLSPAADRLRHTRVTPQIGDEFAQGLVDNRELGGLACCIPRAVLGVAPARTLNPPPALAVE